MKREDLEKLVGKLGSLMDSMPKTLRVEMAEHLTVDFLHASILESVSKHVFMKEQLTTIFKLEDDVADEILRCVTLRIQDNVLETIAKGRAEGKI